MSRCEYYSCFKGKPKCNHPTHGDIKTNMLNEYMRSSVCDFCKFCNRGLYPSQIPKIELSESKIDIIDKDGNVIIDLS